MPTIIRHIILGILAVLSQWLIFERLRIWGTYPDVALLFVAVIALQYGRLPGMLTGFSVGFIMDALSGTWGIQMFIKTLVGFILGLFPDNERDRLQLFPTQAFVGSLVLALFHNGLQVVFYVLETSTRGGFLIFGLWLGNALYTAGVAFVFSFLAGNTK